jgi:hypothetical protein
MEIPFGPYGVGIDNVSAEGDLPKGAVADAVNVEFNRDGRVARRAGFTQRLASSLVHSLWSSQDGRSYGVDDGELSRFRWNGSALSATGLATLEGNTAVSYTEVNDSIVCGNAAGLYTIDADDNVQRLGLQRPGAPVLAASPAGGLHAGRYAVAVSFLRGNEEGPLSYASFVQVDTGGGISITTEDSSEATMVRVYRSEANGETLYRCMDVPLDGTFSIGVGNIGRQADTQHLEQMIGGQIVRSWRGHLLVARGRSVFWSEPMRYGLYDPRHNFAQFARQVVLMEPVEGGVFVAEKGQPPVFMVGTHPKEWTQKRTSGDVVVPFTGVRVQGSQLGGDTTGDTYVAGWLARNGFVIGSPDGSLREVQAKRIRLPESQTGGVGAAVVHDRQIIATIN